MNLLGAGLSLDRIAEQVNRSPSTVSYWLKRHGLRANGSVRFGPKPVLERSDLARLADAGLSVPEMAQQMDCTAALVRRYLERYGLASRQAANRAASRRAAADGVRTIELNCKHHGLTDHVSRARGSYRCMRCRAERVSEQRRRIKRGLIERAGGRCVLCGYDRCAAALQFHHLDPDQKAFHLSRQGVTRSWSRALAEAEKCALLCANCHAEVEVGFCCVPPGSDRAAPRGGLEPPNLD